MHREKKDKTKIYRHTANVIRARINENKNYGEKQETRKESLAYYNKNYVTFQVSILFTTLYGRGVCIE